MALNYDLTAIPEDVRTIIAERDDPNGDYKAGERIMSPVTNSLIWATLGIGMGEITEENVYEFYGRLRIQEALNGPYLVNEPITLEQVKAHIGMRTNVFPKRSNSQFLNQVFSELARSDGGKLQGWKDDYQEVVQWARGLVDARFGDASEKTVNNFCYGLDSVLPSRDTYPQIDSKGGEMLDEDEDD